MPNSRKAKLAALTNAYIASLQDVGSAGVRDTVLRRTYETPIKNWGGASVPFEQPEQFNLGSKILDILTRPLNTVTGFAAATAHNINVMTGDVQGEAQNPFGRAAENFVGDRHDTGATLIEENLKPGWGDSDSEWSQGAGIASQIFQSIGGPVGVGGSFMANAVSTPRNAAKGVGGLSWDVVADPVNGLAGGIAAAAKFAKKAKIPVTDAKKILDANGASQADIAKINQHNATPVEQAKVAQAESPLAEFDEPFRSGAPESAEYDAATGVRHSAENDAATQAPENVERIIAGANTPIHHELPVTNIARPVVEPGVMDGYKMGGALQELTTQAAKRIAVNDRAAIKPPGYLAEVNPEEYFAAASHAVQQGVDSYVRPSYLARDLGIGYKEATRYVSMMEKDGILARTKNAPRAKNEALRVVTDKIPDDNLLTRAPRTDLTRAEEMHADVLPAIRSWQDAQEAKGLVPEIKASDGKSYKVSTADIFEALPPEVLHNLQFGAKGKTANLYPSQWHAGAAEALRMDALGASFEESVASVANHMRSQTHPGATRMSAIERTGNLDAAAQSIVQNVSQIALKQLDNAKRFAKKDAIDARAVSKTKADEVFNALENGSTQAAIESVAGVGSDVANMARKIGASDNAGAMAAQDIAPTIAKVASEADVKAARAAKATARDRTNQGARADEKVAQRTRDLAPVINREAETLAAENNVPYMTVGEKADMQLNTWLDKLMHPVRKAFSFGYGTGGLNAFFRKAVGVSEYDGINFRNDIAAVSKKYGKDAVNQAWTAIRRNIKPVDGQVSAAYDEVKRLTDHVFGDFGPMGRLFRNGASVSEINKALGEKGFKFKYDEKKAKGDYAALAQQSRDWDITDPLSDLEKINSAALLVEAKQATGAMASQFGSALPKPGWVKLRSNETSTLGAFVDRTLYYPKEAGEFIQRLDELAGAATTFRGEKGFVAGLANNVIDPVMQIWKPYMTIARPGHHWRNLLSDVILGTFDGLVTVKPYKEAQRAMQAGGMLKASHADLSAGKIPSGSDITLTLKNGEKISYARFYQMAHDEGILQSYLLREDIMEQASGIAEKLTHNAYMHKMGQVSEYEGQYTRLAHFWDKLNKGVDPHEAGLTVRKFHPDVKGLTPIEQKYLRRIFPFYSWFRQSAPVILSTMVSKPGRVTGIFKAEQNAAIAMGQNPESIDDPFPDDRLYPAFIRDNIVGPLFGDVGLNVGSPQEGILGDTLNGNIPRNLAGMANPLLKAPYEILARKNVGTGANIADMSDYIDQQLPIANQVSNIVGQSASSGFIDPQRAVEKGEKDRFFNLQMVNFLTGLGLQDYGKPSYKTIAAKERAQE